MIVAVDLVEKRLQLARELGATHAVDGRGPDLVAKIMATTGGRGMDYSLDATGADKAVGLAMQVLAIGASRRTFQTTFVTGGLSLD